LPPPTNTSCFRKRGAYCCCCCLNNVDMVWCRMPNATGCPHAPPLQVCLAPHVSHAARREQGAAYIAAVAAISLTCLVPLNLLPPSAQPRARPIASQARSVAAALGRNLPKVACHRHTHCR
jgi:hypothetical protein